MPFVSARSNSDHFHELGKRQTKRRILAKRSSKNSISDLARAARKLQEERDGKREISDFSAPALRHIALDFESNYKQQQSRAGSKSKRKEGIWKAVREIRKANPEMHRDAVWENLYNYRIDEWLIEIEEDRLLETNFSTGKTKSISRSTFNRHYFSNVLKKD